MTRHFFLRFPPEFETLPCNFYVAVCLPDHINKKKHKWEFNLQPLHLQSVAVHCDRYPQNQKQIFFLLL